MWKRARTLKQKKINCEDFVSDIVDFGNIKKAIKKLEEGKAYKKIIIKF